MNLFPTARITAEPIYELKMTMSLHAYLCAEHVASIRVRVREIRDPQLRLERVPNVAMEIFFDEILTSPMTQELLVGMYEKALPALDAALRHHLEQTTLLADAPNVRLIRFLQLELEHMLTFGPQAIAALVDEAARKAMTPWIVKRYGMVLGVKAERLEEYKRLHAAVWPEVLATIYECNIRNYSIYLRKLPDGRHYLFSYFKYTGNNFHADMAKMAADPTTQRWWQACGSCQEPLANRKAGGWWASMEEVFHFDAPAGNQA